MKLKGIEKQIYLQRKNRDRWLETADPFLIKRLETSKQVQNPPRKYFNDKGKKITRRQFRNLNRKKSKKFKKPKKLKYKSYIHSKEWLNRKTILYEKFGRECMACDSNKNLNVHHSSYRNLGNEADDELVVLCKSCHEEYHELNGVQANMIIKTAIFIRDKKEELHLRSIMRGV